MLFDIRFAGSSLCAGKVPVLGPARKADEKASAALLLAGIQYLSAAFCIIFLTACTAPRARVEEVTTSRRLFSVGVADQGIFLSDRASRFRVAAHPLPPSEQREELLVTWAGASVDRVRLEYRQVNAPNHVFQQEIPTDSRRSHTFEVRGDDYLRGGPVTAWRVSLWEGDHLLAERISTLW
jgi:hypothetical protein